MRETGGVEAARLASALSGKTGGVGSTFSKNGWGRGDIGAPKSSRPHQLFSEPRTALPGKLHTGGPGIHETLSVEDRAARLLANLEDFVGRVCAPA